MKEMMFTLYHCQSGWDCAGWAVSLSYCHWDTMQVVWPGRLFYVPAGAGLVVRMKRGVNVIWADLGISWSVVIIVGSWLTGEIYILADLG